MMHKRTYINSCKLNWSYLLGDKYTLKEYAQKVFHFHKNHRDKKKRIQTRGTRMVGIVNERSDDQIAPAPAPDNYNHDGHKPNENETSAASTRSV